ncbi:MAG: hypothetical protein K5696_09785 [Lachnospiraceae bacterium]|nr:hypothetical protein [Lachnospiraceae bacterium]
MKAVVLEVNNGCSAVLAEDGTVIRLQQELEIGRTICLKETAAETKKTVRKTVRFRGAVRAFAAAAAAILVACVSGTFYQQNSHAFTYVSVDVNPSIEFSLNGKDRVLDITPMNEDAERVVEELVNSKIKGRTLSEALVRTREVVDEMGFGDQVAGNTYLVDISSNSEARTNKLAREVEETFTVAEGEEEKAVSAQLVVVSSTIEDRNTAQSLGISTGRYSALKQAVTVEARAEITSRDVDTFKTKAVKDIVSYTDKNAVSTTQTAAQKPAAAARVAEATPEAPQTTAFEIQQSTETDAGRSASSSPANGKKKKPKKSAESNQTGSTQEAPETPAQTEKTGVTEDSEAGQKTSEEGDTGANGVQVADAGDNGSKGGDTAPGSSPETGAGEGESAGGIDPGSESGETPGESEEGGSPNAGEGSGSEEEPGEEEGSGSEEEAEEEHESEAEVEEAEETNSAEEAEEEHESEGEVEEAEETNSAEESEEIDAEN